MIDHTGILVSDFERSKDFYARALAPLGYEILMELSAEVTGHTDTAGFGEPPKPDFWISGGTPNQPPIHVAFLVDNRHMVDDFHDTALAPRARCPAGAALRPSPHHYHYGA